MMFIPVILFYEINYIGYSALFQAHVTKAPPASIGIEFDWLV